MEEKAFYHSKTFWFNGLTILITVATFLGFVPNKELMDTVAKILVGLTPFINFILRFTTKKPLGLGALKQE